MAAIEKILLSTAFFPSVTYIAAIAQAREVQIESHENYLKQTYRNRCEILTANGLLSLSIPVSKPDGHRTQTRNIVICNRERWQLNHWRAMQSAYLSSPFFLFYRDEFEHYYHGKFSKLLDFDLSLTGIILKILGIDVKLKHSLVTLHSTPGDGKKLDRTLRVFQLNDLAWY